MRNLILIMGMVLLVASTVEAAQKDQLPAEPAPGAAGGAAETLLGPGEPAGEGKDETPVSIGRRVEEMLKSLEHDIWGRGKKLWPWAGHHSANADATSPEAGLDRLDRLPGLWMPGLRGIRLDAHETDDEFLVEAELPGFDAAEIQVGVLGGRLMITASHKSDKGDKTAAKWKWRERAWGTASRTLLLPSKADVEGIKASFENGLLNITIPKLAAGAKGSEIQSIKIES